MTIEKNTDICVVMDVDITGRKMTLYSPLEKKNIVINVTDEVLDNLDEEDVIAFEIDLDKKEII